MVRLRLGTKFLISMLIISSGLTCTTLLVVRHSVRAHVTTELLADLHNSVTTFRNFQRNRESTLAHSAELLADLPILRALMTTQDERTIQDASGGLWSLAGSDLFVLANRSGKVVALQSKNPGLSRDSAEELLRYGLEHLEEPGHWWFGGRQLYEVFLRPVYFGKPSEDRLLGFLAMGYEIDDRVLEEMRDIAAGQIAFRYGNVIARSTLPQEREFELLRAANSLVPGNAESPYEIELGKERFLASSVELAPSPVPVSLIVLISYDQATRFLVDLNRLLLGLGLLAVLGGSALVFLISHRFTKPLGELVSGVRALGEGNFSYPLQVKGHDEVAEVTAAFDEMRLTLQRNRQALIDAERLATIGRMAGSISHDLRHALTAVVANAEFLCKSRLRAEEREELYGEIGFAVERMTDLLDSLLEFSRTREALRPTFADLRFSVEKAVQAIRAHPESQHVHISLSANGEGAGWFDPKKLERVLYNLLLNACEAAPKVSGRVEVEMLENSGAVEIRIRDNGRGIPDPIRDRLFEPFVSYGKENGSGLGLAVAQKITQDHGGEISVERTSEAGTVFRLIIPLGLLADDGRSAAEPKKSTGVVAGTKSASDT